MHTLAIVDDHELFRRGLKDLLTVNGNFNTIFEADNGHDFVTMLETMDTLPDVCILDVSMPVLNGYETMEVVRKKWPDLKVLALSMYGDDICVVNMIHKGARGYVLKDSPSSQIEEALFAIINDGFYHSGIDPLLLSTLIQSRNNGHLDLNTKELRFLELACSDLTYNEIAGAMNISPRTVDGYRDILFKKFNVKRRTSLAIIAMRMGLVPVSISIDAPTHA